MRVAVYHNNRDIRVEERPRPQAGPGEVVIRILSSGICGSDLLEWYRIPKAPIVLGHEVAGQVVETGEGVRTFTIGDRVTAAHHVPCNTCRLCLGGHHSLCETLRTTTFDPGGFAEYVRLPRINVDRGTFLLPDEVSDDEATFVEPLACTVRAQRIAGLSPGKSVLVLGSGMAGMLHVKLAAASGAGAVIATDIQASRLEAARRAGATHALDGRDDVPKLVKQALSGWLADITVVCADSPEVLKQAFDATERGGTILLFALPRPGSEHPLDLWDFWKRGITITSSYAGPPRDTLIAIDLLRSRRVEVSDLITHRLPLARTAEGFRLMAQGKDTLKVIIHPQE